MSRGRGLYEFQDLDAGLQRLVACAGQTLLLVGDVDQPAVAVEPAAGIGEPRGLLVLQVT